jgi:hypothetical protein
MFELGTVAQVESPRKNVVALAVPVAKRAVATVPDERFEAFSAVKDAPDPLNVPATKVFVLGLYVNVASLSCNRP